MQQRPRVCTVISPSPEGTSSSRRLCLFSARLRILELFQETSLFATSVVPLRLEIMGKLNPLF